MKEFISDTMGKGMQGLHKGTYVKVIKRICTGCFLAGFVLFFIFGREFAESNNLLNVDALCRVKDSSIDKKAFYAYIFYRRSTLLMLGLLFWWWRLGKYYTYTIMGVCAFSMGGCMYTCLLRYDLKGLFLWIFLYFPHVFFYTGELLCAVCLSRTLIQTKEDKLRFLCRNFLPVISLILLHLLGMYTEAYTNTTLLQDFLTFF